MAGRDLKELKELFEKNKSSDDSQGSMSIAEFAELLNEFRMMDHRPIQEERTIRNHISKIYKDSNITLRQKQSDGEKKGHSIIKISPAVQGPLMTLCDSQYCGGRSINRSLTDRAKFYKQIISNIEKYFSADDQAALKERGEYKHACECIECTAEIDRIYKDIQTVILNCDPSVEGCLENIFINHLRNCLKEITAINLRTSYPYYEYCCVEQELTCLRKLNYSHMNLAGLMLALIAAYTNNTPLDCTDEQPFAATSNIPYDSILHYLLSTSPPDNHQDS